MKEFIEKLIGRLEENSFDMSLENPDCKAVWTDKAIDIVKQLAEEYKQCALCYLQSPCEYQNENAEMPMEYWEKGWIPCSERLPKEPFGCLVTVMDCEPMTQTDFENILPYHVGYDGETWNDADGNVIPFEVIAWQPLPEPYKEEAEQALAEMKEV